MVSTSFFSRGRMTAEQLQQGTEFAWKHAYSMDRASGKRLRQTPARSPLALLTNLAYRRYAHGLHKFYNCDWILDMSPAKPRSQGSAGPPRTASDSGHRSMSSSP